MLAASPIYSRISTLANPSPSHILFQPISKRSPKSRLPLTTTPESRRKISIQQHTHAFFSSTVLYKKASGHPRGFGPRKPKRWSGEEFVAVDCHFSSECDAFGVGRRGHSGHDTVLTAVLRLDLHQERVRVAHEATLEGGGERGMGGAPMDRLETLRGGGVVGRKGGGSRFGSETCGHLEGGG